MSTWETYLLIWGFLDEESKNIWADMVSKAAIEALLRRAIAINPKCPVGHWQLSGYLAYICDCRGAERHHRQAYDLNADPGKVWGRWWWRGRS